MLNRVGPVSTADTHTLPLHDALPLSLACTSAAISDATSTDLVTNSCLTASRAFDTSRLIAHDSLLSMCGLRTLSKAADGSGTLADAHKHHCSDDEKCNSS